MRNMQPGFQAQLDQDWKSALEWVRRLDGSVAVRLVNVLTADDGADLIDWIRQDPKACDIVQRLALLALQQSTFNLIGKEART